MKKAVAVVRNSDYILVGNVILDKISEHRAMAILPTEEIKDGEDAKDAAARAAAREVGMDFSVMNEIETVVDAHGDEIHYIECVYDGGAPEPSKDASKDVQSIGWVEVYDLEGLNPEAGKVIKAYFDSLRDK